MLVGAVESRVMGVLEDGFEVAAELEVEELSWSVKKAYRRNG